jgi:hypothetical protein
MAKDCPREQVDGKCFQCGEVGHTSRDCPNPNEKICHKCGKKGHLFRDCPDKEKMTCFKCGELGHVGRDCPNPDKVICNICHQRGHMAMACPNKSQSNRGPSSRSDRDRDRGNSPARVGGDGGGGGGYGSSNRSAYSQPPPGYPSYSQQGYGGSAAQTSASLYQMSYANPSLYDTNAYNYMTAAQQQQQQQYSPYFSQQGYDPNQRR